MKITFFAYLFYIVVALLDNWLLGGSKNFNFSLKHIINVVLFSVPTNVPGQLWFMIALLEVYIIYFFVEILHTRKLAYIAAVITFVFMLTFAQGTWLCGYEIGADYYRNAWIEGFSFFTLGYFLHDKQDKMTISNNWLIIIIALSVVLSIVERFVCGRIFAVHIFTYPLVTGLFVYAIKNSDNHAGTIQLIGKKYSMYVYILHLFFWNYCDKAFLALGWNEQPLVLWLRPLIVLGFTMLASMGCYALFNRKNVIEKQ